IHIPFEPIEPLETRGQVELLVVRKNHHRELLAYSPACGRVALQISRSHRCGTSRHSRSKSAATAAQSRGWKRVYRRSPIAANSSRWVPHHRRRSTSRSGEGIGTI